MNHLVSLLILSLFLPRFSSVVCPIGELDVGGSCVACSPTSTTNCLICTKIGSCDIPNDGFYLSDNGATRTACTVANCKSCPNNVCQTCKANFFINANRDTCITCSPTAAHLCTVCPNAGVCDTCKATFVYSSARKVCECEANKMVNPAGNCETCNSDATSNCLSCPAGNICLQAKEGYYLVGNTVTACGANCKSCSSSNCDVCNPDFFVNAGVCASCSTNCKTCTSAIATACTSCDNRYILESGSCVECSSVLTKCSTCATGGTCTACQTNYVVTNGICAVCPSNSLEVSGACVPCSSGASHKCLSCPESTGCLVAFDGYYIDPTTKRPIICPVALGSCQKCTSSNVCTLCNSGNLLNFNNICEACSTTAIHKCSSCSTTLGKCDTCMDTYFVNANNVCTACATNANCKTCLSASSTQCLSCLDTFILESGSCVSCAANSALTKCETCAVGGTCTKCQTGYVVVGSNCVQCPVNHMEVIGACVTCGTIASSTTKCLSCPYGNICVQPAFRYFIDANGRPSLCIGDCKVCTGSTGCSLCMEGYLLKSDNTCEQCASTATTKCSSCPVAGKCATAQDGYFIDVDFKLTPCKTNCKTCTNDLDNACTSCNNLYILESGECVQCLLAATKTKCKTCATLGKCTACQDNYLAQSDVCVACPAGCKTCTSTTVCSACNSGYMLVSGVCLLCQPGSSVTKCEICSTADTCTQCASGYRIVALKCETCISNCVSCSAATGCDKCANGYILNSNTCVACGSSSVSHCLNCPKDGKCTECDIGYFVDPSNFKCTTCNPNCITCSNSLSNCQSCVNNYILEGNSCESCVPGSSSTKCTSCPSNGKCISCQDGFYVNEFGRCASCAINCKTCSSSADNQCQSCNSGYTLEEGECIKCEAGSVKTKCELCAIGDQCTQCALTYFVNTNTKKCEPCASNCKTCSAATADKCTTCNNEYILVSGSCVKCSLTSTLTSCATCPTDGKCTSCQETYYLNNYACSQCTSICQRCSDGVSCSLCKPDYTLTTDSKCARNIANCNIILGSDTTKCSSCNYAYGFTDDSLCAPEIPYCTTIDKGTTSECKVCNDGYGFNLKRTCEKCTPSCKSCSDSYEVCNICVDGYYLAYDICLRCDSTCATCLYGQTCTKCANGYFMEGTKCVKCGSEGSQCQACATNGVCTLCSPGYFYVTATNKCTACSEGCAVCTTSAANQCTSCSVGYLLNSAALTCTKCTEPCKTCLTSVTTCSSCLNNYVLSTATCKLADCSLVANKPFVLINDYSCNECNVLAGYIKINSTHCVQIANPKVKINVLEDGNVKANVNCLNGKNIYYSYGIANSALISLPTIKSQITTPIEDLLNFLVVGRLTNIPGQDMEWVLTGLKNTGENYIFRAYCEVVDYATSPVDVNFITTNNTKAESLMLYVKTDKVLTATTKTTVSQAITSLLSTTKTLWTEDDVTVIQTTALASTSESNVYKFSILPDYSNVNVDPYLNAMKAYITKNQNEFTAKLNNSLIDIGINAIVVSTFQTDAPAPSILFKNATANYSSIVVNWKQNTPGRVTVFYKKNDVIVKTDKNLNFILTDTEFTTLSSDSANLVQYKYQVPANEEVPLLVYNLTANTTYRLYYYGENDAIPKRKTVVMGEILTTLNQTINGLEMMKFCLIAMMFLWIAVLV